MSTFKMLIVMVLAIMVGEVESGRSTINTLFFHFCNISIFFFFILVLKISDVGSQCISFESIRNSNLIFDDDNATCERLDLLNATLSNTLGINKSCTETSDVSK